MFGFNTLNKAFQELSDFLEKIFHHDQINSFTAAEMAILSHSQKIKESEKLPIWDSLHYLSVATLHIVKSLRIITSTQVR